MITRETSKIIKWFGDFGGDICTDTDMLIGKKRVEELEKVISSDSFGNQFEKILKLVMPEKLKVEKYNLDNGRILFTVPKLSKFYIMAGHLAIAQIQGKERIEFGTYIGEMALRLAKACKKLQLPLDIILSQKLSRDESLIRELKDLGCNVDTKSCNEIIDLPHAFFEKSFFNPTDNYVVRIEANYGTYPKPGLVGFLGSRYGEDIKKSLDGDIDCCVVPIKSGTEAVSVLKTFTDSGYKLATVEDVVAQEFHITELGAYTLSTRSAEHEQMNTTICPELVNWWRSGSVLRLGCDTIAPVDVEFLQGAGLNPRDARAAALAFEKTDCDKILLVKENGDE